MDNVVEISAAVEGHVDEAVVRKLISYSGGTPGTVYGKNGKSSLRNQIHGYNNAARYAPWLILVDLDQEECAPLLYKEWLPYPASYLCFRVAVREVEAWLMADSETLARFLNISPNRISRHPETLIDPKNKMVNLARHSRSSEIQKDMVPRAGSGRPIGPAYTSRLVDYIQTRWRPQIASKNASSLKRAIECLRNTISTVQKNQFST